jgi:uncharacterized protein (UPF0248 family)
MIPIHQLLNRIHWDREFGAAAFEIGYYDRLRAGIVRVPLAAEEAIVVRSGGQVLLPLPGEDGLLHSVPLHRIREVFRNGLLIWQRPGLPGAA